MDSIPVASNSNSALRSIFNSPLLKQHIAKEHDVPDFELENQSKSPKVKKAGVAGDGGEAFVEPILRENPNRFTLFPIAKPKLYQRYKNQVAVFWTVEEVDLSKDMKDWDKLNTNEKYFIKNILGFFAGSDGIVQENLASRFMKEIQLPEARAFYSAQLMIESIHGELYSLLIDTYIQDKEEKLNLFRAIQGWYGKY